MAEAARPNDPIAKEMLEAYLDRYAGLEQEAIDMVMETMRAVKDGPRASQKDLKKEMKSAGIRMGTFNLMWAAKSAEIKLAAKFEAVADDQDRADDYEQIKECAKALSDTPFGEYLSSLLP